MTNYKNNFPICTHSQTQCATQGGWQTCPIFKW